MEIFGGLFGSTRRTRPASARRGNRIAPMALCAVLAMSVLGWTAATASATTTAPRADYRFQHTLASSLGAPPSLTDIGPGTNSFDTETVNGSSQTVLAFPTENGVRLAPTTGVIPNGTYTIAVLFRFATTTSRAWQRIVDFRNGTSDFGLYAHEGTLELYPYARGATATIKAEEYVLVVLTRDSAGTATGYVNGAQQFSFNDSSTDDAVIDPNNTLRFFRDNETGAAPGETSAGAVARIQLYDEALTAEQVAGLPRVPPGTTRTASANVGSLSFAPQLLGTLSSPQVVLVTNTGSGDLPVHRVQMKGTNLNDFLLSSDGCSYITLLVGESCSIGVRFSPSERGGRSATLTVSSADPLSPLQIPVSGTGGHKTKPFPCTKLTKKRKHRKHTRARCATERRAHRHTTGRAGASIRVDRPR
jgi:hypothetical protein